MNKKLAEAQEELSKLKLKNSGQPQDLYQIKQMEKKVEYARHDAEFAFLALDIVKERIQEIQKSLKENEEKVSKLEKELSVLLDLNL
jgi:hypothetical protein